jgi:hypothetical protein
VRGKRRQHGKSKKRVRQGERTETGNSHLRTLLHAEADHRGEGGESTTSHGCGVGEIKSLGNVENEGFGTPDVRSVTSLGEHTVTLLRVVGVNLLGAAVREESQKKKNW